MEWNSIDKLYRARICHIEKTKLKLIIAKTGLVNIDAIRNAIRLVVTGFNSLLGSPSIKSGGAIKVSMTCWNMCILNKYWSLKICMGDSNAKKITITPTVKLANSLGDAASVIPNLVLIGPTASK